MDGAFSVADLDELAECVDAAWRQALEHDWSARAGGLEWSCAQTADHVIDTLLAPAFFLASRRTDDYPAGGWVLGDGSPPIVLVDSMQMSARLLGSVVAGTDPGVRAIIWRRPTKESRPPSDFVPRGALELILHAHDVCTGLGIAFDPPMPLCARLRDHTQHWPLWGNGDWPPLARTDDPWTDLLIASGRER